MNIFEIAVLKMELVTIQKRVRKALSRVRLPMIDSVPIDDIVARTTSEFIKKLTPNLEKYELAEVLSFEPPTNESEITIDFPDVSKLNLKNSFMDVLLNEVIPVRYSVSRIHLPEDSEFAVLSVRTSSVDVSKGVTSSVSIEDIDTKFIPELLYFAESYEESNPKLSLEEGVFINHFGDILIDKRFIEPLRKSILNECNKISDSSTNDENNIFIVISLKFV